ncbi:MAG: class I SAM-dependent methyltransferase [Deltaproteobacteria bacterium]|jgi:SAM-dependent methyltransferase|nr:class I SAM-dependent methyltransferase [Deltaproteobacteria bacterium]
MDQYFFSYSEMLSAREECVRRFGNIFSLPVLPGSPLDALSKRVPPPRHMLDFGAGPQRLKSFITSSFPGMAYHSLDADTSYGCDWACIDDIPVDMTFSLICADQVLEHIPLEDSLRIMRIIGDKLAPGGIFYASVPNVAHPVRYWSNIEHCTHVSFVDLYYYCSHAGLKTLALYRYGKRHIRGWIEKFFAKRIQDIYRMDYADSICIVAEKPGRSL